MITVISAAVAVCFAALTTLGVRAALFPARRFHPFSVVAAIIAFFFFCLALRTLITGTRADEDGLLLALRRGMFGAFAGLILIIVSLLMFGDTTRSMLAHAVNQPTSSFTTVPLLVAFVLLGFAAGFVISNPARTR